MGPKGKDRWTTSSISNVLDKTFAASAFRPLLITQVLFSSLLESPGPQCGNMVKGKLWDFGQGWLHWSSQVGPMADSRFDGSYAYRASKVARNSSISTSMALELKVKGVVVVGVHPSYTATDLDPSSHAMPDSVEPGPGRRHFKIVEYLMRKKNLIRRGLSG